MKIEETLRMAKARVRVILFKSYRIIKCFIQVFAAIPVIMTVLDLIVFGFPKNHWVLQPILKPRATCHNNDDPETEGRSFRYKTEIFFKPPLYLYVIPYSWSLPFELKIEAQEKGVSFTREMKASFNNKTIEAETTGSNSGEAERFIFISWRFTSKGQIKIEGIVTTPNPITEDECPFTYEAKY